MVCFVKSSLLLNRDKVRWGGAYRMLYTFEEREVGDNNLGERERVRGEL
jgi:hypothetical protein